MSDKSITYQTYLMLIKKLTEAYGLNFNVEHEFIHELFEGEVPLFKLLYGFDDKTKSNHILISMHLEVSGVDAIQWYDRVYTNFPNLMLTESYIKDDNGETFVGQAAEILCMRKIEQKVLNEWTGDKEEAKELVKKPVVGRTKESRKKVHLKKDRALKEFNNMSKGDDDEYH